MIRMSHPDLPGQQITVPDAAVSGHQRSGWVIDTTPPPPEDLAAEVVEDPDPEPEPESDETVATAQSAVARRSEHTPVAGKE